MAAKKQYLLGIDIGTSAVKVALFQKELGARALAQAQGSYPTLHPTKGYAEQNPDDWWHTICRIIPDLLCASGISPAEIAAVGVDGQSWAAVAVGADGEALSPTPIWSDTRAADTCAELICRFGEERFFSTSCNRLMPGYTFPKLCYYKKHMPEIYNRAVCFLQSNGYIVYRLTGQLSCDLSQGYGLACFDMRRGVWDEDLCREAGIDPALLPPLFPCHAIVGGVSAAAALACGLAEGTPVVAGGLDTACDALGAGVISPGTVQEQGGQSGGMSICTPLPLSHKQLILCRHVVPNLYLLQGGTAGGGATLRWFDSILHENNPERCEKTAFLRADEEAASVPAGAEGLILLPYLAGERSPLWDSHAKGVYYGLDYAKTRAHFHRANLESAAYALRHNLETAAETGVEIQTLRASGGASKSPLWCQIKADVTGYPVEVGINNAAAFGAAMLAGVAVGIYSDFHDAMCNTPPVCRYEPNPQNREIYDITYARYRALYDTLSPLMHGDEA